MDGRGVNSKRNKRQAAEKRDKRELKVVYISTPMKVKTCASKFRSIVQELTGKDSDTSRFLDANNVYVPPEDSTIPPADYSYFEDDRPQAPSDVNHHYYSYHESSQSSDSSGFEQYDDPPTLPSMDENFMNWFEPSFIFHEPSKVGIIN